MVANNHHVFISYSSEDIWEYRSIYKDLRLAGFRLWVDKDLSPGSSNWKTDIDQALRMSACVVCICSPNSAISKWVNNELQTAKKFSIAIYPVVVGGESLEVAIPPTISDIQAIDCRMSYKSSIDKLLSAMIIHHESAQETDLRTILASDGISWTHFGSLFWFASEVRKLRLLLLPEEFNRERIHNSLRQLLHHSERINIDKFSLRDIHHVISAFDGTNETPNHDDLIAFESKKLRMVQDNVAKQAERVDRSFTDGPVPGRPIISSTKNVL